MHHVAIMKKSWGLVSKILSGEKTIESRWYKNKSAPWGKIQTGDTVWFKNSGEPVTVRAIVSKVLTFEGLTQGKVRTLLEEYGGQDGLTKPDIPHYFELFQDKKYCLLIFLEKTEKVAPFAVAKKGFGAMAAWLTLQDIKTIKVQ
ncbi:MAG: hypothetical protein A2542_01445 [Parcubacteria group bacterium RIFOXYD2_FULL_52_8]|nr:MAG: hypothetical protein A2542_01445 [Parcubacteria group bacterium RIFOXYD2_FULL_52_8]